MKNICLSITTLLMIMLPGSTAWTQLEDIDGVEKFGFWVDALKDGENSPGILSLRWRMQTAQIELEMIQQRINELKARYDETAAKQREIKERLFQHEVTGTVDEKLAEVNARIVDTESQLASLSVELESLTPRMEFELKSRRHDKQLAEKQRAILEEMLSVKRNELDDARKLASAGSISLREIAKLDTQLKEMELRVVESDADTSQQGLAAQELQAEIAGSQAKLISTEKQLEALQLQREKLAHSSQIFGEESLLEFDQALSLKMIEKSSLRALELDLEIIRYRALLSMVESKLKENEKKENK